jgi:hypothetical protein
MSRLTLIYTIYGLLSTTSGLGVCRAGPAGQPNSRTVGITGLGVALGSCHLHREPSAERSRSIWSSWNEILVCQNVLLPFPGTDWDALAI